MTRPNLSTLLIGLVSFGLLSGDARGGDEIKYRGYFPSFPAPAPAQGVGPDGTPGVWLGADSGFCCPLDEVRSYWSFADVAIGVAGAKTRKESSNFLKNLAVGNTIAIAFCRNGRFSVEHYFRGPAERPLPFFRDPNNPNSDPKGSRLWLRKPTLHKGKLYIFAQQILDPGGVFNTLIIRVDNPLESPNSWNYEYLSLGIFPTVKPAQGKGPIASPVHFGTEAFLDVANNYLYTYGCYANQDSARDFFASFQLFPLRIPLDRLETAPAWADLGPSSQFLTSKEGVWKAGLHDPNDYHHVGIPAFNGFSVRYNHALKAWQAIFQHDKALAEYLTGQRRFEDPAVNTVFAMTGKSPFGPWSKPLPVAKFPEMDPEQAKAPDRPHGTESYGYIVNEIPAFETWDGDIAFVYSIGSYTQGRYHNSESKMNSLKLYNVYAWPAANPFFGPIEANPKP